MTRPSLSFSSRCQTSSFLSFFALFLFFYVIFFIKLCLAHSIRVRWTATPSSLSSTSFKANSATHASLIESAMSWTFCAGCSNLQAMMPKNSLSWCSTKHQDGGSQQSSLCFAAPMTRSFAILARSPFVSCCGNLFRLALIPRRTDKSRSLWRFCFAIEWFL